MCSERGLTCSSPSMWARIWRIAPASHPTQTSPLPAGRCSSRAAATSSSAGCARLRQPADLQLRRRIELECILWVLELHDHERPHSAGQRLRGPRRPPAARRGRQGRRTTGYRARRRSRSAPSRRSGSRRRPRRGLRPGGGGAVAVLREVDGQGARIETAHRVGAHGRLRLAVLGHKDLEVRARFCRIPALELAGGDDPPQPWRELGDRLDRQVAARRPLRRLRHENLRSRFSSVARDYGESASVGRGRLDCRVRLVACPRPPRIRSPRDGPANGCERTTPGTPRCGELPAPRS